MMLNILLHTFQLFSYSMNLEVIQALMIHYNAVVVFFHSAASLANWFMKVVVKRSACIRKRHINQIHHHLKSVLINIMLSLCWKKKVLSSDIKKMEIYLTYSIRPIQGLRSCWATLCNQMQLHIKEGIM